MKDFFDCKKINIYLNDILNNNISEDAKKLFFLHLENCKNCMQLYKTSLNIKNTLHDDTIYLGEDFTEKVMEKIKSTKRKTPFHRVTRIFGPAVAVAACFLFIFAIANKGLLDKGLNQLKNENLVNEHSTKRSPNFQEPKNEDNNSTDGLLNGKLPIKNESDSFTATEDDLYDIEAVPEEEPGLKNDSNSGAGKPSEINALPEAGLDEKPENRTSSEEEKSLIYENDLIDLYKDNYSPENEDPPRLSSEITDKASENFTGEIEDTPKAENNVSIFDYFLSDFDEVYANENYKYTAVIHLYPADKTNVIKTLSEKFNFVTQKDDIFYIYTTADNYDDVRNYFNIPGEKEVSIKPNEINELTNFNTVVNEVHMAQEADISFKNFDSRAEDAMLFIRIYNENYDSHLESIKN